MKKKTKSATIHELVNFLGNKAPYDFAEEWDNVGLLSGDPAEPHSGTVTSVNLGPESLQAAQETKSNLIVCHHPPIFKPLSNITKPKAPYLYEAIRNGISVLALHTNFDLASEELSKKIAKNLGFSFTSYLAPRGTSDLPASLKLGKFVTFLPSKNIDQVREAIFQVGAGQIGNYSQCSFSWEGEGTFRGNESSTPKVGKAGRLEKVQERRLEILFNWSQRDQVLAAARAAHPYEEMAFDLLALEQPRLKIGYGFLAEIRDAKKTLTFHKLLDNVKEVFRLRSVTVSGPGLSNPQMKVQRLAFSPGSGSSFIGAASAQGADAYVCGEVGYHSILEARQKGLTLIILGHSYSERFFVEEVSEWCAQYGPVRKVFETIHDQQ